MMLLGRDVLSNTYHNRWIGRGGPTAWSPCTPDLNPLDFYLWGHLKSLVYAAPIDNEEALHNGIVDACQTICSYPGIFERMRRSTISRVESCNKSHGGHIEHLLNVSGHMLIWTFLLVLVCATRAQSLSAPFSYTL
jgi:hypothetical protein